ncbi:hypothetical protein K4L44_11340 [Halosquirtibacter laminarini]|uniref:Uncharacterized protein n=1 Tax=Halosquirtibacter laminarini TaxID=3374600 RepID=A0AC61NCD4_9BACT|nr:hypothetical protein K4L44_11340 [Prolixibacteraceae bacterium]
MKHLKIYIILLSSLFLMNTSCSEQNSETQKISKDNTEELTILWTTDNANTAINFISMYSGFANSRKFFSKVNIIIWGRANELIKDNDEIHKTIKGMLKSGIKVKACRACSDKMGTTKILEELGVEVDYLGNELT